MSDNELIGKIVDGVVSNVAKFGAFVKLENGEEGLVHISEVANQYVTEISGFVSVDDKVSVKILKRNDKGKLELSMKQSSMKENSAPKEAATLFIHKKTKNEGFEDRMTLFLKKSDEKQVDIRRNLKHKQGVSKKKK
jgi:S1 RNA binding domain protein